MSYPVFKARHVMGSLCLKYGGGGHLNAGTCQVETDKAEQVLSELIATITSDG